jgi:hypothetical protein
MKDTAKMDMCSSSPIVRIGDFVKVHISFPPDEDGIVGENFWCVVTRIVGGIQGAADNSVLYTDQHGIKEGDTLDIPLECVFDIDRGELL